MGTGRLPVPGGQQATGSPACARRLRGLHVYRQVKEEQAGSLFQRKMKPHGLDTQIAAVLPPGRAVVVGRAYLRLAPICPAPGPFLIGGEDARCLAGGVASPDVVLGTKAAEALADLGEPGLAGLLEARRDSDLRAHRRAVAALVHIGAPAVPGLVAALERAGSRVEMALVCIGGPALPELEKALASPERARAAARVLGAMGERARPAVSALLGLLQDTGARRRGARAEAAVALGADRTGEGSGRRQGRRGRCAGVGRLAGPPRVRLEAKAQALGKIGPSARRQRYHPSLAWRVILIVQAAVTACEALGPRGRPGCGGTAGGSGVRLLRADAHRASRQHWPLARLGPEIGKAGGWSTQSPP